MLEVQGVQKVFQTSHRTKTILQGSTFEVAKGECISLVGPSGCGKTTLLRIVAGLESATAGKVVLNGVEMNHTLTNCGYVSQQAQFFPWLTVRQNLAFAADLAPLSAEQKAEQVDQYLRLMGLAAQRDEFPAVLSGGLQQRLVLGQVLIKQPDLLLLDEPFASLDVFTRKRLQEFLVTLQEVERKTTLFITHDLEEALFLSDRILLMDQSSGMIRGEFVVPFLRPRTSELRQSLEFFEQKRALDELFARVVGAISLS